MVSNKLKKKYYWKDAIWGYLFILPSMLLVLTFVFIPVISSFGISLTQWNIFGSPEFLGFANYQKIFSNQLALFTYKNTFIFSFISIPITIFLSLLLSIALNQKIKGISFYRTSYYLPVISASVAVSLVFLWIFDTNYGLLNRTLSIFGIDPIGWLTNPKVALYSVILVSIWRGLGFNMIIFLAAIQDIPRYLYDAANIDGADKKQTFFNITLPLVSPAIFFTFITGIIGSFQSFDLIYSMTQGGPARATYLIGFLIWKEAFDYLHMGYGAALSFILFLIILVFTLIQWFFRKKWVYGEEV
ncbi:MAG: sugar ABC transporter permease [Anaerolineaceae bacterium]|nr:sugar ABC transporter permease [Anaerolineaceae bacterium]